MNIQLDLVIPTVGITFHDNDQIQFFSSTTTIKFSLNVPYNTKEYDKLDVHELKKLWQLAYDSNCEIYEKTHNLCNSPKESKNDTLLENKDSDLVQNARACLERGKMDLCPTGVGGTYFVRDETNAAIAVFKPSDEEPGALNNPKCIVSSPILPPGGGAKREVAAFLLGHDLANVPETRFLETLITDPEKGCSILKSGSIQKFIENAGDATTFGSSNFCTSDVHNIGILDLRLLNKDRNGENILVQKSGNALTLVPIDHAYVLPNNVDDIWFEWMTWRQTKQPFSQKALDYIASIDIEKDITILRSLDLEEDCIKLIRLSTALLQCGAAAGLTLFDIASMVCRKRPNEKSDFEYLIVKTKDIVLGEEMKKVVQEVVTNKLANLTK